jgi:hypothetical protein
MAGKGNLDPEGGFGKVVMIGLFISTAIRMGLRSPFSMAEAETEWILTIPSIPTETIIAV